MALKYGTDFIASEVEKPKEDKDITAEFVGDFGKWQFMISFLMSLLRLPSAWYQLNIIFLAPPQDFWCAKPESCSKFTTKCWRRICAPLVEEEPCLIYDPDLLSTGCIPRQEIPLVTCKKFEYDNSVFTNTITSEWNLVCSQRWLVHLTQCMMMWGVLLGGIFVGVLADKYGRRIPLLVCIILQGVLGLALGFVKMFWWFMVVWFVLALVSGGIATVSFVMCMEVVSGKWRTITPVLFHLPYGLGNAAMAGIAYYLRNWRHLEIALGALTCLYIVYWIWLPESPRWLLAMGRNKQALQILEKAALMNNRDYKRISQILDMTPGRKTQVLGFKAFCKSRSMRIKTILLSINWFGTGIEYYTLAQYLGFISENIFLTVAISGVLSVPGSLLCVFIINKMGRKITLCMFSVMTAICFLSIWLIPKDMFVKDWPRLLFAGIGFAGMAGTVPALYLYCGELFPTLGRNVGVGGVSLFARIGSMLAPLIVSSNNVVPDFPLLFLTAMTVAQIFALIPLPETKDMPLPDTIEEAENFELSVIGFKGLTKIFRSNQ